MQGNSRCGEAKGIEIARAHTSGKAGTARGRGLWALQHRGIVGERGGSTRAEFPGSYEQTPNLLSRIHPRAALPSSSCSSCVDVRSRRSARLSREPVRQSETASEAREALGARPPRRGKGCEVAGNKGVERRGERTQGKEGWLR